MKGRKPKPTWLKVIAGNPGNRALNDAEPVPTGDLTAPPTWMNETQQTIWRDAIRQAPPGLLRELDESCLTVWVVAATMHRDASQRVARMGTMVQSPSGYPIQNPYLAVVNKQAAIMLKAAAEMGFTPSARSRVRVDKAKGFKKGHAGAFADLPDITDA
jgi:P27 family predicted phage terminase small subunit